MRKIIYINCEDLPFRRDATECCDECHYGSTEAFGAWDDLFEETWEFEDDNEEFEILTKHCCAKRSPQTDVGWMWLLEDFLKKEKESEAALSVVDR